MSDTKQRKATETKTAAQYHSAGLDLDQEIEQGLKALAEKARQGDAQALKLLIAYREERKGDAEEAYLSALTEVERRALRSALVREIISLRKEIKTIRGACNGA